MSSNRSWGSLCIGDSLLRFGQSTSISELSSSDPQCSDGDGGLGERGGLRVGSKWGDCISSVSSSAGPGRPFLLTVAGFVLCRVWLFFGDGVLVICDCGLLLV